MGSKSWAASPNVSEADLPVEGISKIGNFALCGDVEDDLASTSNGKNQELHFFGGRRNKNPLGGFATNHGTRFMLEACCRRNEVENRPSLREE